MCVCCCSETFVWMTCAAMHNMRHARQCLCTEVQQPDTAMLHAGFTAHPLCFALPLLPAGTATASEGRQLGWAGLSDGRPSRLQGRAAVVIGAASSCRLLLHTACMLVQHVA